jgi:DNA-binding MarR family transcriptional regulator
MAGSRTERSIRGDAPTGPRARPTQWLDDREGRAWMGLIGVLHKLPIALDSQLRRDAGLTHFEYAVLASLSSAPSNVLTMSELATITSGSLSRLSHVVKRMEERGWVKRSPLRSDGRITVARITAAGVRKITAAAPGHVAEARRLVIDALDPAQLALLAQCCATIVRGIDDADGAACGGAGCSGSGMSATA